jgi:hypothetical protein
MSSTNLRLDLHKYAGRDDKAIEGLDRACVRFENIDHALVRSHFELFAGLFINMRAAKNGVAFDAGRDGDGAAHLGVGTLGVFDDLLGRDIQGPMIVSFHPNSYPIARHVIYSSR